MVAVVDKTTIGSRVVEHAEILKWVAFACMLVDHINVFVLGNPYPSAEYFGSLTFPLFVFAFAAGLSGSTIAKQKQVFQRMAVWAVVAQVMCLSVRGFIPANILFTFALGLFAYTSYQETKGGVVGLFFALALGAFCEYSIVGVLFVFATLLVFTTNNYKALIIPLLLLAGLYPFNSSNHFAYVAPLVVLLALILPRDLPRLRGVFYPAYAIQFPLLAVAARVLV